MSVESNQVTSAVKWSLVTEIIVKFISPITNMILARLLTPEIFGLVASIMMITTFAEMFTDAGFQKYIVQHQFVSSSEQDEYISVAFWTNLGVSIFFYLLIFLNAETLANLSGVSGYETVIRVYSLVLPLMSYSSIQYAVYRKNFHYKKLGIIRVIAKLIPVLVTIPSALYTQSYWSLVIGNLVGELVITVILIIWSTQRIKLHYDYEQLKSMFMFCGGSMLETLSSWLVSNVAVFIISQSLGAYYLGLYKISITTVNQIISIITASTMNVLFATLSKVQNDSDSFNRTVNNFQKSIGLFTIPLGVGIFVFRKFITLTLLGPQWEEASLFVGLWGFVMCESVIFADIGAYAILSKGKPGYVFLSNILQALLLATGLLYFEHSSFMVITYVSFVIRWQLTVTHYWIASKVANFRLKDYPKELNVYVGAASIMGCLGLLFQNIIEKNIFFNIVGILICIIVYFGVLMIFNNTRIELLSLFNTVRRQLARK